MPEKFPLADLFAPDHWHIATAGVLGALILAFLIIISLKYFIDLLGGSRWWYLQRWGLRFAVFFTVLHVLPMKWESWSDWFISGGGAPSPGVIYPDMVPASLLVTLFLLWVCVVRIYESWSLFRSLGIETKEISMDPVLKQQGRNFFGLSLFILIVLYLIILVRWIG